MNFVLLRILFSVLLLCSIHHHKFSLAFPLYEKQQAEKPNILWLITEDSSPYFACYGDSTAYTPNLNRLAKEGITYKKAYDVSGVCAPSRAALITGMYPTSIGAHNMRTLEKFPSLPFLPYEVVPPPQVKMFSELMRRGGYYCTNNAKEDYQFKAPLSGWDESSDSAHWRNQKGNKPFFSVFTFMVTHESRIWMKKNDPLLVEPSKVKLPPYYPESPVIRQDVARMYSNIMEMDKQVGKLLHQLEKDNLLDKTIIIFSSDNGGPLPRGKRELYNSGIYVPLIVRYPDKQDAGTYNNELVSFVDFAPSILSIAGIKIPEYMQGRAFMGTQKTKAPEYIFAARDRMDTEYDMVRTAGDGRFKYFKNFQPQKPYIQNIEYRKQMPLMRELEHLHQKGLLNNIQELWFRPSKPKEELYDTESDPFELHNIAGDPSYQDKLIELRSALDDWMKRTGDKGLIPEKQLVQSMLKNGLQPQTENPFVRYKNKKVVLSSATPGASLSWQVTGKGDKVSAGGWQLYVAPFTAEANRHYHVLAERIGYKPSGIVSFEVIDGKMKLIDN